MPRHTTLVLTLITSALACASTPASDDEATGTTTSDATSDESTTDTATTGSETAVETTTNPGESVEGVDGFDMTLEATCDVWWQDCPEGEKCVPYSNDGSQNWNDYKCVPVQGDQAPGEPCTSGGIVEATDDCDATSICFDTQEVDGMLVGTCHAQCTGSPADPMCPDGSSCLLPAEGTLTLCLPQCDPLAQDCPAGDGCYWTGYDFYCVVTLEEGIPTGQPCGYTNDCEPGNQCVEASYLPGCADASCCTSYCDLSLGDADCAAQPGSACTGFFLEGEVPAGFENVGVCVLPP